MSQHVITPEEQVVASILTPEEVRYADGHLDAFGAGVQGAIPTIVDIKFNKQGLTPEELMSSTRKGMNSKGEDALYPQAKQLIWSAWAVYATDGELSAEEAFDAYKTLARGALGHNIFRDAVKQGVSHVLSEVDTIKGKRTATADARTALKATAPFVLDRIQAEMALLTASGSLTDADRKKAQALANALLAL
jgi:hypothetical protein